MRTTTLTLVAAACFVLAAAPASAGNDETLANMKGQVAYQQGKAAQKPVAPNAKIGLSENDYAITGADSLAAVGLPDSSRVLVGAESKIQLVYFKQAEGTSAKFLVYNGRVRFEVQHPSGAKANYQFSTPTASIAVRGTQGDISTQSDGSVRVNVYEVCDPSLPVEVTTKDGQKFQVVPGQSFFAQYVNGRIQAKVDQLTQQMIDQFSPDFGVPHSWDEAKGQVVAYAQNAATGAVENATGNTGIAGQVVSGLGNVFGHKKPTPTPAPSATPASTTCSH